MTDHGETEVLAVVHASPGRRFLGLLSLGVLGVLLLYIAFMRPPAPVLQLFLVVTGAAALWLCDAMRRATASSVVLTEAGLADADGTPIATMDQIAAIDRGFFAFKPSNGFLIRLSTGGDFAWRPGLWWRIGRRVGVGGMTPGHQSKNMSDVIAIILARRDGI